MSHEYGTYSVPHWTRAAPDSVLGLAVAAYSQVAYGRMRRVDKLLHEADRLYERSFMKTHHIIREPSSEGVDESIMATMLMALLEVSPALLANL